MLFKNPSFYALLVFATFSVCLSSCKNESNKTIKQAEIAFKKEGNLEIFKTTSDSTKVNLDIEIADNDYEIQTGLMYRNSMKSNQGMLFIFDDTRERFFYMKNTKIPLDLIFINDDKKIVSFQKNAKPFDETSLPSNFPAKYVLEINAGLVDSWSIAVGDEIDFQN
ncbi:DUF192 domain-containing protein [Gaetbulibacter sp. M235]|uniref:DUF192 domain-containing protein n=1 Tax=Gaetbulibacter sp. M235 TaxID=3126510 RepID=UPI00374FA80C